MKEWSVVHLLEFAWKRIVVIACVAAACAAAAFSYCKFVAVPEYAATASVMVTNGAIVDSHLGYEKVQGTDISASLSLCDTVVDILNTPDIYKLLADKLDNQYKYNELMNMTAVERKNKETLFINIMTTSVKPAEAKKIVNAYANLVPDYINGFVPNSNVVVAAEALNARKVFPNTGRATVFAGLISAIAIYVILFVAEGLNKTVDSECDFVEIYKIPLLGTIPDFDNGNNDTYYSKGGNRYGN